MANGERPRETTAHSQPPSLWERKVSRRDFNKVSAATLASMVVNGNGAVLSWLKEHQRYQASLSKTPGSTTYTESQTSSDAQTRFPHGKRSKGQEIADPRGNQKKNGKDDDIYSPAEKQDRPYEVGDHTSKSWDLERHGQPIGSEMKFTFKNTRVYFVQTFQKGVLSVTFMGAGNIAVSEFFSVDKADWGQTPLPGSDTHMIIGPSDWREDVITAYHELLDLDPRLAVYPINIRLAVPLRAEDFEDAALFDAAMDPRSGATWLYALGEQYNTIYINTQADKGLDNDRYNYRARQPKGNLRFVIGHEVCHRARCWKEEQAYAYMKELEMRWYDNAPVNNSFVGNVLWRFEKFLNKCPLLPLVK